MNSSSTERLVQQALSSSNPDFYPSSASWVSYKNYKYLPYSNECGVRTLLALTLQALHPSPYANILLPLMHPNLSNIAWTWITVTLLWSHIPPTPVETIILLAQHFTPMVTQTALSSPGYLIPWHLHPSRGLNVTSKLRNHLYYFQNTLSYPTYTKNWSSLTLPTNLKYLLTKLLPLNPPPLPLLT